MARVQVPAGTGNEHQRIWKLAPHLGAGVSAITTAIYEQSSLPVREREVARMRIAQLNQCNVCLNTRAATAMRQGLTDELYQSVNRYDAVDEFTPREKLAAEFAEQFAIDHTGIDDAFWARMREHFSDTELLELTVTVGVCVGLGRAFNVLDIARDFDVLWSKEPSVDGA
jgi:AhpD family alkylhydroperoxidase